MNIFNLIPIDKQAHFLSGIVIAVFLTLCSNPILGISVVVLAGLAKELIIDTWMKMGNFERADFFATCAGGLIGAGMPYVASLIKPFIPF